MESYLQRYLAGDYHQVWSELTSSNLIFSNYKENIEVAHVVRMAIERAAFNVGAIVEKLRKLRYEPVPVYSPPKFDEAANTVPNEKLMFYAPLSLKMWYSIIGEVDLTGTHPEWKVCGFEPACIPRHQEVVYTEPLQIFAGNQVPVLKKKIVFYAHKPSLLQGNELRPAVTEVEQQVRNLLPK